MMKKIYPLLTTLATAPLLAVSLAKKDLKKGALRRFLPEKIEDANSDPNGKNIWIHAASAGEVQLANLFAKSYLQKQSGTNFLLTTNTNSGMDLSLAGPYNNVRHFPFDSYLVLKKIFKQFRPDAIVLVELELWPGLISMAKEFNVPVFVINARVSASSVEKFTKLNNAFDSVLSWPIYLTRNDIDMDNLLKIGVELERILVTGEMKIDLTLRSVNAEKKSPDKKILLAVSTHPGEEQIILEAFQKLRESDKDLKLLIAPRHQRRVPVVLKLAAKYGFASTAIAGYNVRDLDWAEVLIEDRFGRMNEWYAMADLAIVGGSLVDAGCHNVIEPVLHHVPVITGPYHGHWKEWATMLDESGVLSSAQSAEDISRIASMVMDSKDELLAYLVAARARILQQTGVTERNTDLIVETLAGGDPLGLD